MDKVHVNHQYQCLPPLACWNIKQLGLHRRGKRRKRLLDIIRPCRANPKNLIRVRIEVNISKYQPDRSLTFSLLNAQSVKNNDQIINHQIVQNKTDILLLTETWLTSEETDKIWLVSSDLNRDSYKLTSAIRKSRRGGALVLVTKKDFKVNLVSDAELRMFQFAKWNVQLIHTTITILGIYRSPAGCPTEFLMEFTNWITDVVAQDTNLLVAGDLSLHINSENDDNAANFKESMVPLGLVQQVTRPTHKSGNILDLIFTDFFLKLISTAAYWATYYQITI